MCFDLFVDELNFLAGQLYLLLLLLLPLPLLLPFPCSWLYRSIQCSLSHPFQLLPKDLEPLKRKMSRHHHTNPRYARTTSPQEPPPQVNGVVSKLPSHRRPSRERSRHRPNGASRSYDSSAKSSVQSKVDYSLYLVADSTPRILGDRNIVHVVDAALRGGTLTQEFGMPIPRAAC